jgi:plasmid stabilization system protein ParE
MTVHWTRFALDQLMEIADGLAERNIDRARAVVQRVLARVGGLAELPWSGPPWRGGPDPTFRRLVVDDHVVLYRVVEATDSIYVLAVRHGRQRPPEPGELPSAE